MTQCLVCSGYGYYRPNITLFDPGWRGEQTKGPEDSEWGVVDLGNDPTAIVDRHAQHHISHTVFIGCLLMLVHTGYVHDTPTFVPQGPTQGLLQSLHL